MSEIKIAFIGAGNMATAIIKGLVGNSVVEPDKICVCDVDMDKAQNLSTEIGIEVVSEAEKLAEMCHIIVLAVKPQNYAEVLEHGYAARASNLQMYDAISQDILSRWASPFLPENNIVPGQEYRRHPGGLVAEKSATIAGDAKVSNSIIGA